MHWRHVLFTVGLVRHWHGVLRHGLSDRVRTLHRRDAKRHCVCERICDGISICDCNGVSEHPSCRVVIQQCQCKHLRLDIGLECRRNLEWFFEHRLRPLQMPAYAYSTLPFSGG